MRTHRHGSLAHIEAHLSTVYASMKLALILICKLKEVRVCREYGERRVARENSLRNRAGASSLPARLPGPAFSTEILIILTPTARKRSGEIIQQTSAPIQLAVKSGRPVSSPIQLTGQRSGLPVPLPTRGARDSGGTTRERRG
eukprot:COSAG02_NODE_5589_length_4207_cov_3.451558_4_plen_143_part_00